MKVINAGYFDFLEVTLLSLNEFFDFLLQLQLVQNQSLYEILLIHP